MEQKKCSMINHKEIDCISYCQECKIYMCNKCEKYHQELFINHHKYKLDKDTLEIFTGLCNEQNHLDELIFFCKTHNKLCCSKCITKIKTKDKGQHTDCKVCLIEDIEKDKKNELNNNIKILEDLSINLDKSIDKLKEIYKNINKNKEELKINVQQIFTKLRNELNDREDKLLLDIEKKYEESFFKEDIIKQSEKLPNKIKIYLENGKLIDQQWNNKKLNLLINDCLNIENNIKEIKFIHENINKYNKLKTNIKFFPSNNGVNELLQIINKFGKILKNELFDSEIEFDQNLVKSWLNNKNFIAKLLYRKSRDGSTPDDFHKRCDNKGITITFIETTKGYKFGGYTEFNWDCSNQYKKDESAFIFSFNNEQKYTPKKSGCTIACDDNSGPRFGNDYEEIYLYKNLNKGESYDKDTIFVSDRKLTNGEQYWDVKELEVYKIEYI